MGVELNSDLNMFGPDVVTWEYGQLGGRVRPIDRDILFKNLVDVHNVLDKYKIRHWLSHGTVLGAIREGNFLAHDDDCDLGLDFSERHLWKPAQEDLRRMGFHCPDGDPNKPISKDNAPYWDLNAIRDGEKVEGWCFEKQSDDYWIYDKQRCGNTLRHPGKYYNTLDDFNFRGVVFKIPAHVNPDWLEMMYGKTWNIEDKNAKYRSYA